MDYFNNIFHTLNIIIPEKKKEKTRKDIANYLRYFPRGMSVDI